MPKERNLDYEEEVSLIRHLCWSSCNFTPISNPYCNGVKGGISKIYFTPLSEIEVKQESFLQPIVFVEEVSETTEEQFNEL